MDELARFARQLAERLAARTPGSASAVSVAEIRRKLLPYGTQRRALGLSSVEEYETMLLRLIAEERGYVKTEPPAAAERCREELGRLTPDLGVLEELGDSLVELTTVATNGESPPPAPLAAAARASQPPDSGSEPGAEPAAEAACRYCAGRLPADRTATFCPWCGKRLIPLRCADCGEMVEAGWRHCIACGAPVDGSPRAR